MSDKSSDAVIVRVSDVMTPSVRTINRTSTVLDAIKDLRNNRVSSLVVERRDENDEFGVVTVTDVAKKVVAEGRAPERVYVYEVMNKPMLTVAAEMNIVYAIRLLVQFDVSRAVVTDHNRKPVGIVTLRDMVLRHAPGDEES